MISAAVKVYKPVSKLYREAAQKSPTLMRNGLVILVRREREDLRDDLLSEVAQPEHPFVWSLDPVKQARARRWWFKQIKLGTINTDGSRYIRSGAILSAFKLISNLNDFDGLITITNDAPGAEWVVGGKQVPSHALSGWPQINKVAIRSRQRLNAKARVLWRTIARPEFGAA